MTTDAISAAGACALRAQAIALLRDSIGHMQRLTDADGRLADEIERRERELAGYLAGQPVRLRVAEAWPGGPVRRAGASGTEISIAPDGTVKPAIPNEQQQQEQQP